MNALAEARRILAAAERVVAVTGAGLSAESGIPTFRGPEGLWRQYRPEQLATPEAFTGDPLLVWEWYYWRRERISQCVPNPGHIALAEFEARQGPNGFTVVTQNVDGLHGSAGSRQVLAIHGDIWITRCTCCSYQFRDRKMDGTFVPLCPECEAPLRPGVVWFGEDLPHLVWDGAVRAVNRAQVLLVIGTSSVVYPAAGLTGLAKNQNTRVIEINLVPTPASPLADIVLTGQSGVILPELLKK